MVDSGLTAFLPGTGENDLFSTSSRSRPSCEKSTPQVVEQLPRLRILDQRVQQMFEADEIVAAIGRQAERAADALERFGSKRDGGAAHARCSSGSGSIVTSSGNSCCSASRFVAFTFVSATSRV